MKKIFLLFSLAVWAVAQTPAPSSPATSTGSTRDGDLPAQRVGPDDLLSLSVADCPELTRNFRVSGDGLLVLPLVRKRISVNDMLPREIEVALADELKQEQLLVQPVVSVSVAEYRSIPVSVLGAVRHPLTFQATGNVMLLDALTRADGLSPEAGPEILISRPRSSSGASGALIQRVPVKALIDEADPAYNIRLRGGEEIRVPEAGKVFVIGNVKKTGAFPVGDGNDTTVLKMIALTEGFLPYTNKDAFIYRREAGKADRNEIPVPLSRIIQHKSPDIALLPNDILYVPDSKGKRISAETLRTLTTFGVSTATGVLIWR